MVDDVHALLASLTYPQLLGYLASAVVFATFCMTTMLPLRIVAVLGNLLFVAYGYFDAAFAVMALHLVLLPINLWKLRGIFRLVRHAASAEPESFDFALLAPFTRERRFHVGDTVFRIGDRASEMYYVKRGDVLIEEYGTHCRPGDIFGEIALFSTDRQRTGTAICVTDCTLLALTEARTRELYYQHPAFAFRLIEIIVARLVEQPRPARPSEGSPAVTGSG